jgi:predicted nucleotidyltransferase
MDRSSTEEIVTHIKKYPQIQLFMLFGSRARGDVGACSDWDFAYIAKGNFDLFALFADLTLLLKTDKVDLVNLSKASGLLRFRAAKDGTVLYQKDGEYEKFWLQAVHFWCDAGPIIRAEYDALLRRLAS